MTNVPAGAAASATRDKYYVYRPLLDLIGLTEGTDKGRGYNETLGYGRLTGGPVDLVKMTLTEIDGLQTRMLSHQQNIWNSSAVGRYQIVRTTLRSIRKTLGLAGSEKYDADMQDRLGCFLLGQRGIDKYLAGRLSEDTMMLNLAQEWASLPTPQGAGYYSGQRSAATPAQVRAVLAHVRKRHAEGQPVKEVPVMVEKPVVPPSVEHQVEQKSSRWQWLTGLIGSGGLGLGWLAGMNWQAILAGGCVIVVMMFIILLLRRQIVGAVKEIREGLV